MRVNTFPTARSLPFFVGIEKGFFARHGIKLEFEFTENSKSQREGLAAGKFEVVQAAVDNAIAMIEVAKIDVVIVSGGDGGTNEFIVGKGIEILRRHPRQEAGHRRAEHRLCAARHKKFWPSTD